MCMRRLFSRFFFFFFCNDTATTEIYTLSLHDALPISEELPDSCDLVPAWPNRLQNRPRRCRFLKAPGHAPDNPPVCPVTWSNQARLYEQSRALCERLRGPVPRPETCRPLVSPR